MRYTPDKWVLVELIAPEARHYRVLGSWFGGYLNGNSWRLNSGVKDVHAFTEGKGNHNLQGYEVDGESGSMYIVYKTNYGMHTLSASVLDAYEQQQTEDMKIRALTEEEAFQVLDDRV